jgi:integrase
LVEKRGKQQLDVDRMFTIAKWTGHANTRMIEEVYGHLNTEYRRGQMAMLKVV